VTKFYYLELLHASEGTLSRWSRLHLQSLAPTPVSRRVDVRQAAGRKKKINAESLSQHDEKHVVPTPVSGIWVGGRKASFLAILTFYLFRIKITFTFSISDRTRDYCTRFRIVSIFIRFLSVEKGQLFSEDNHNCG
jgi:hypothetical protein